MDLRDWLKSVALTQAVIGAATAVVLMWTARDVSGDRWSWFVGLLWATYPPAILNTVVVFPQTLQVFWLVTAFWLVVLGTVRRSFVLCAAAGVCWSASCLTRSGNLLFLPIFALAPLLFSWLRTGSSRHWAAAAAAVIFAAGAVSAGWWTARDFTKTYRLEHLILNGHERHVVMFLLRPLEPVHGRVANALLRRAEQRRAEQRRRGQEEAGQEAGMLDAQRKLVEQVFGEAGMLDAEVRLKRPQFSWTLIRGESNVQGGEGNGSIEERAGEGVGGDGGSPEGDRSARRRRGR